MRTAKTCLIFLLAWSTAWADMLPHRRAHFRAVGGSSLLTGLNAYYKLDTVSGTSPDSLGVNALTNVNGVTSAAGQVGNAAVFNSANSTSLTHADSSALGFSNSDFTIAMWVKLASKGAGQSVVSKDNNTLFEYEIYWGSGDDRFHFYMDTVAGGKDLAASTFGAPAIGTAYFIICKYTAASGGTMSISVNNGTPNTLTSAGAAQDVGGAFHVGSETAGQFMENGGWVDELGIWGRATTGTEDTTLYKSGTGTTYPSFN
jgi:hypothetical protein